LYLPCWTLKIVFKHQHREPIFQRYLHSISFYFTFTSFLIHLVTIMWRSSLWLRLFSTCFCFSTVTLNFLQEVYTIHEPMDSLLSILMFCELSYFLMFKCLQETEETCCLLDFTKLDTKCLNFDEQILHIDDLISYQRL
jgi:hypothetical protein